MGAKPVQCSGNYFVFTHGIILYADISAITTHNAGSDGKGYVTFHVNGTHIDVETVHLPYVPLEELEESCQMMGVTYRPHREQLEKRCRLVMEHARKCRSMLNHSQ